MQDTRFEKRAMRKAHWRGGPPPSCTPLDLCTLPVMLPVRTAVVSFRFSVGYRQPWTIMGSVRFFFFVVLTERRPRWQCGLSLEYNQLIADVCAHNRPLIGLFIIDLY